MGITITGVEITGDLREAKVFYTVLGAPAQAAAAGKWLVKHRDIPLKILKMEITFDDGILGSSIDEGRSKLRKLV